MLVAPIAVFTPFVLASRINTGLRHLFPVYPFLFILISLGIMGREWKFRRASVVLIAALLAAVSVTPLEGVGVPAEQFAFLRPRTPIAKVGYSIYVYDLRR